MLRKLLRAIHFRPRWEEVGCKSIFVQSISRSTGKRSERQSWLVLERDQYGRERGWLEEFDGEREKISSLRVRESLGLGPARSLRSIEIEDSI